MTDYLNIGPTPYDVDCAQVGSPDYIRLSTIECRAFALQCQRVLRAKYPDYTVRVGIKAFPHDFGTYWEVVVYYDPENEEEIKQAFYLESADISDWDKEAIEQLESHKYTLHLNS